LSTEKAERRIYREAVSGLSPGLSPVTALRKSSMIDTCHETGMTRDPAIKNKKIGGDN
jgi:hypothetical protein